MEDDDELEPQENEENGMWDEKFKTHFDSKPYGKHYRSYHVADYVIISRCGDPTNFWCVCSC